MSFPAYAEYQNGDIEWLPKMPAHWRSASLRWLSSRYSGGTPDKNRPEYWEGGSIPWLASGEVNQALITEPSTFISEAGFANSSAKWIPEGALVIALAGQGKTKGMVAQLGIRSTCNQSMAAVVPNGEIQPRFLFWWLQSNYQNIRNMAGGDLRDGLNLDLLGDIPCPLPLSGEQAAIAAFLDRETAKIDALVGEQKRLIELLKEKRQAVISQAVTKGLDPKVPMKDSGVEWLGEVPAHWNVKALKFLARVGNGSTPNRDNPDYWSDVGFPWLNSSVVNQDEVSEAERYVTPTALKECHLPIVEPPAVLVGITGQGKTRGMAAPLRFVATVNQHVAYIKPKAPSLSVDYLLRALEAAYVHLRTESESTGSTKGAITCGQLGAWRLPLPSVSEQEGIASYLDDKIAELDSLNDQAEQAIALLQERRSALISAAVTGKINVSGQVPQTEAVTV